MKHRLLFSIAVFCLAILGCASGDRRAESASGAQLFDGMGRYTRPIATRSGEAQRYFDQGLIWAYAFNHDEALRCFRRVTELDPDCAMGWWGMAYVSGPHINNAAMSPENNRVAWTAAQEALARLDRASEVEAAMIRAVAARYAETPPADRGELDRDYASAMEQAWYAHQDDPDVGTIYAEALMNLQPWDLWTHDGRPKGRTPDILAALEHVRRIDADHPGANHLYIHAQEAGPSPEKAIDAADRLRKAVPIAGHLVHMPSHIDVQVGRWALASDQNEAAIRADEKYRKRSTRQGFYHVYMAHNRHFLAFSAMMEGRRETALRAAREMLAAVPPELIRDEGAMIDPYAGIEFEVLMRFGRWDDVLRVAEPPESLPITRALWRFARGVACAAKGDLAGAEREQAAFVEARKLVPPGAMMAINPAERVLQIAEHMLNGEIAYRRGSIDEAVRELSSGVAIEDGLVYMEPPDWIQPVRHTLGAVLLEAGRTDQAEAVYRADLRAWPENGWSLYGLARCLEAAGKVEEAAAVEARFRKSWARADTEITASCLCVRPTVRAAR